MSTRRVGEGRRRVSKGFRAVGVTLVVALTALALEGVVAAPASAEVIFTVLGNGYGHGVGLSQYGAKGRADAGHSAAQILGFYYPGTTVEARGIANPRIKLVDAAATTVAQPGGVLSIGYDAGPPSPVASAGETVTFAANGDAVAVFAPGGLVGNVPGQVVTVGFTQGVPASLGANARRYKWGRLVLRASDNNLQVVVDSLTMDQYLNGLGEMPGSWATEALRAQAVAARSFATYRVAHPRSADYDLVATVSDQAYNGADQENGTSGGRWVAAVNDTSGQILTYGGNVVQAFYSSSNGGFTESSGYVFATGFPYYVAADDPYDVNPANRNAGWGRTYTGAELRGWLASAGFGDVGEVTGLSIGGNVAPSGRVDRATVTVTGRSSTVTITGNQLRSAVNAAAPSTRDLLSTKFAIAGPPVVTSLPPSGVLDGAGFAGDQIGLAGWAIDSDDPTAPVNVHVYIDGRFAGGYSAALNRPDIGAVFPTFGPNHGYFALIPSTAQRARVCAYAIDAGGLPNPSIGCIDISRNPPPKPAARRSTRRRR